MKPMYHIGFGDSHKAKYAILPGDPGRVERIATLLDEPRFFHQNREYTTWLGKLEGENVLVMSTGMGGPSTAIGVEELCQTGVTTFIRVGTCGGMQLDVVGGDLVVATGAVRMEGTSHRVPRRGRPRRDQRAGAGGARAWPYLSHGRCTLQGFLLRSARARAHACRRRAAL